jgi:hypothetical protein
MSTSTETIALGLFTVLTIYRTGFCPSTKRRRAGFKRDKSCHDASPLFNLPSDGDLPELNAAFGWGARSVSRPRPWPTT